MTLVEILELVGSVALIVGVALAVAALVPWWLSWPLGLVMFGVLMLGLALLVERAKGGGEG